MDSNYVPALVERGKLFSQTGDSKRAIEDFNRARSLSSTDIDSRLMLASDLMSVGSIDEADIMYQEVIAIDNKNRSAHAGRGILSYINGQWQQACTHFNLALGKTLDSSDLLVKRASCLIQLNRHAEAQHDVDIAIKLDPSNFPGLLVRAQLYATNGRFLDAIQDFKAFITTSQEKLRGMTLPADHLLLNNSQQSEVFLSIARCYISQFYNEYPAIRKVVEGKQQTVSSTPKPQPKVGKQKLAAKPSPQQPQPSQTPLPSPVRDSDGSDILSPAELAQVVDVTGGLFSTPQGDIDQEFITDLQERLAVANNSHLSAAFNYLIQSRVIFLQAKEQVDPDIKKLVSITNEYLRDYA